MICRVRLSFRFEKIVAMQTASSAGRTRTRNNPIDATLLGNFFIPESMRESARLSAHDVAFVKWCQVSRGGKANDLLGLTQAARSAFVIVGSFHFR